MRSIVKEKEAKKQVRQQVDNRNIIDEYGALDAEIKKLTKIKDALREKILNQFGEGEHAGLQYTIQISTTQSIVLDPVKVAKEIGVKEALKIASISVEKARALMGVNVEKCISEVKESTRITVRKNA